MVASTTFRIWDHFKRYPTRDVDKGLEPDQFEGFVDTGVLSLPGFIEPEAVASFGDVIDSLAELELGKGQARLVHGNGYYVRDLLFKDAVFHPLLRSRAVGVARQMLGPRVQMRADARIAFQNVPDAHLPWHLHFPGFSDPLPPWFSPPHSVHCLIYLDDVGPDEGELLVLPGSYKTPFLRPEDIDESLAVTLAPQRGDAVFIHGNTWHRTNPSQANARRRRILFLGFTAAWVQGDSNAGGQPVVPVVEMADPMASWQGDDEELIELLGRFRW